MDGTVLVADDDRTIRTVLPQARLGEQETSFFLALMSAIMPRAQPRSIRLLSTARTDGPASLIADGRR